MPLGHLLVAEACLLSSYQPAKLLTFLKHFNLSAVSERLYTLIPIAYLLPTVLHMWEKHETKLIQKFKNKHLTLGGDGHCGTPGKSRLPHKSGKSTRRGPTALLVLMSTYFRHHKKQTLMKHISML